MAPKRRSGNQITPLHTKQPKLNAFFSSLGSKSNAVAADEQPTAHAPYELTRQHRTNSRTSISSWTELQPIGSIEIIEISGDEAERGAGEALRDPPTEPADTAQRLSLSLSTSGKHRRSRAPIARAGVEDPGTKVTNSSPASPSQRVEPNITVPYLSGPIKRITRRDVAALNAAAEASAAVAAAEAARVVLPSEFPQPEAPDIPEPIPALFAWPCPIPSALSMPYIPVAAHARPPAQRLTTRVTSPRQPLTHGVSPLSSVRMQPNTVYPITVNTSVANLEPPQLGQGTSLQENNTLGYATEGCAVSTSTAPVALPQMPAQKASAIRGSPMVSSITVAALGHAPIASSAEADTCRLRAAPRVPSQRPAPVVWEPFSASKGVTGPVSGLQRTAAARPSAVTLVLSHFLASFVIQNNSKFIRGCARPITDKVHDLLCSQRMGL